MGLRQTSLTEHDPTLMIDRRCTATTASGHRCTRPAVLRLDLAARPGTVATVLVSRCKQHERIALEGRR